MPPQQRVHGATTICRRRRRSVRASRGESGQHVGRGWRRGATTGWGVLVVMMVLLLSKYQPAHGAVSPPRPRRKALLRSQLTAFLPSPSAGQQEPDSSSFYPSIARPFTSSPPRLNTAFSLTYNAPGDGSSNNCSLATDCSACVGLGCLWCPDDSTCLRQEQALQTCPNADNQCPNYLYVYIIWLVLSVMLCLCCLTCTTRRCLQEWRMRLGQRPSSSSSLTGDDPAGLYERLLHGNDHDEQQQQQQQREEVFRNSLREEEWLCPVCAFENRPRAKTCSLCTTTYDQAVSLKGVAVGGPLAAAAAAAMATAALHDSSSKQKKKKGGPERRGGGASCVSSEGGGALVQQQQQEEEEEEEEQSREQLVCLSVSQYNQLTMRQRQARMRRLWQRRRSRRPTAAAADGDEEEDDDGGGFVWVQDPLPVVERDSSSSSPPPTTGRDAAAALPCPQQQQQQQQEVASVGGGCHRYYDSYYVSCMSDEEGRMGWRPVGSSNSSGGDDDEDDEKEEDSHTTSTSTEAVSRGGGGGGRTSAAPSTAAAAAATGGGGGGYSSNRSSSSSSSRTSSSASSPWMSMRGRAGSSRRRRRRGRPPVVASSSSHHHQASAGSASGAGGRAAAGGGSSSSGLLLEGEEEEGRWSLEEVLSVWSSPFRVKHLWFVEQLAKLQLPWSDGHIRLDVRRSRLLEDSFAQVMSLHPCEMREWMRVQFVGEPGVDAGGLEREWFILVSQALFDPSLGLFCRLPSGAYTINPHGMALAAQQLGGEGEGEVLVLQYYYFTGRVLGKALMEHQTLPVHHLSLVLLKHLVGVPLGMADLAFTDPELHRSLYWLRDNSNVDVLHLDFTVTPTTTSSHHQDGGVTVEEEVELCPEGAGMAVTDQNKARYLSLRARYHLLDCMAPQLWYMLRGLYEVVPRQLLSVFDYQELQLVLSGLPVIDIADWKRHTEYLGQFQRLGERHHVIRWFWEVVTAMSEDERARLLQFTTGACTVPAQGFKSLQSNDGNYRLFNIQSVRRQESLFPRAHTCFNKLDLPVASSKEELDWSLRMVINLPLDGFTMD